MLTTSQLRSYILHLMKDGNIRHTKEIIAQVCEHAGLTEAEKTAVHPTGESIAANRMRWSCWDFFQAGIFNRPFKATYQITELGRQKALEWQGLKAIPSSLLADLSPNATPALHDNETTAAETADESPDIIAWQAVQKIEKGIALELLARLRRETPELFEKAVIKVLLAMGYGGKENLRPLQNPQKFSKFPLTSNSGNLEDFVHEQLFTHRRPPPHRKTS